MGLPCSYCGRSLLCPECESPAPDHAAKLAAVVAAARALMAQTLNSHGPRDYICTVCERVSPRGTDHAEECEADALTAALAALDGAWVK